jgi:hypothetical protein
MNLTAEIIFYPQIFKDLKASYILSLVGDSSIFANKIDIVSK